MKSLLLLCTAFITVASFGQHLVQGTISDDIGPLPLTNITIKSSEKGVFTDDEGRFSIEAKPTDTLQVSYLGYKTKTIAVGTQKNIQILLNDYEELDEVLIVANTRHTRCGTICCYEIRYINETNQEYNSEAFKLYPNPSEDGMFNITVDDYSEVAITIADLTGRIILKKPYQSVDSEVSIDLSNQPSGIYIINVTVNGTVIASKKAIRI